jgi:hypothetical protein
MENWRREDGASHALPEHKKKIDISINKLV